MIRAFHHVQIGIPKGAEDRARAFYGGVLGMRELPKPESLQGRGGIWMELGGPGGVQVHASPEEGVEREKTKAHAAYVVDDLEAWRRKLASAGIVARDGVPIPGYARFEFRDPFGNRVEFLEALSKA